MPLKYGHLARVLMALVVALCCSGSPRAVTPGRPCLLRCGRQFDIMRRDPAQRYAAAALVLRGGGDSRSEASGLDAEEEGKRRTGGKMQLRKEGRKSKEKQQKETSEQESDEGEEEHDDKTGPVDKKDKGKKARSKQSKKSHQAKEGANLSGDSRDNSNERGPVGTVLYCKECGLPQEYCEFVGCPAWTAMKRHSKAHNITSSSKVLSGQRHTELDGARKEHTGGSEAGLDAAADALGHMSLSATWTKAKAEEEGDHGADENQKVSLRADLDTQRCQEGGGGSKKKAERDKVSSESPRP